MNIEFYLTKLQHAERFNFNKFSIFYNCGNKKDKHTFLYVVTRDAQNEKYTYREVMKLIAI